MSNLNTHCIDLESGSSQYLSASDSASLSVTTDYTIEAWIKLESAPSSGNRMIIASKYLTTGNQRSYYLSYHNNGGTPHLENVNDPAGTTVGITTSTVDVTIPTAEWHHIVVSHDSSGNVKFYIDGKQEGATQTSAADAFDSTADFEIGTFDGGSGSFFDGLIDEVRLWNDVRTNNEILDHMEVQLEGDETGLQAYWKLDNGLLDETSNNNDLTNNNSAVFSTDYSFSTNNANSAELERSSAMHFTAPDSSSLDITGDLTIEAWLNPESQPSASDHAIVDKQAAYSFFYHEESGTESLRLTITTSSSGATATVNQTLTLDTWTHVAVVYDASAGSAEFFVNGSSIGTDTGLGTSIDNSGNILRIGNTSGGDAWDGGMDDVRVWSIIRTDSEISDNYQNEMFHDPENLQAYYKFNNNLIDSTGNENTLTAVNSPTLPADTPFTTTTSYFRPDPSVEDTSVDGRVFRNGTTSETWATIQGNADGTTAADSDSTGTFAQVEASATTDQYKTMIRGFFLFDTSRLPNTDTISSAQFGLHVTSKSDGWAGNMATADKALRLGTSSPASNTALVTADYDQVAATAQATDIEFADVVAGDYNYFTLNSTGLGNISQTGITKFGIRCQADADNSEPTWSTSANLQYDGTFADSATNRPVLKVVHAPGTGFVPKIIIM